MNHHAEDNDACCNARDIAWNAGESIRALNHLTQPAAGQVLAPADIDQIVAARAYQWIRARLFVWRGEGRAGSSAGWHGAETITALPEL